MEVTIGHVKSIKSVYVTVNVDITTVLLWSLFNVLVLKAVIANQRK